MYRHGNSWHLGQTGQRVTSQSLPRIASGDLAKVPDFAVKAVNRLFALFPSWMFTAMILIASLAVSWTAIIRTRAEVAASSTQYARMVADIEGTRRSNAVLLSEIRRMQSEPSIIEAAARVKLSMVRPTDILVPIVKNRQSDLATLSFVR